MKIGFIGLGNMGAPMAANLVAAGHEVTGFDLAEYDVEGVAKAASAAAARRGPRGTGRRAKGSVSPTATRTKSPGSAKPT